MPGMVDCHIHASQYSNAGKALDLPLLQWLEKYTFPTEAKFIEADFATHMYTKAVVSRMRLKMCVKCVVLRTC